jgi:hypothetical protein
MAFADELIALRKAAGFRTMAEFSHQLSDLGYPVSYFELRRYEKGEYLPTLPAFAAIVDALGLTQRELMRLVRAVPPNRSRREKSSETEVASPPPTSVSP